MVKVIVINNTEMSFIQTISQSNLTKSFAKRKCQKTINSETDFGSSSVDQRTRGLSFSNNTETFSCMQTAFETEDGGCRMVIVEVMGGKRP